MNSHLHLFLFISICLSLAGHQKFMSKGQGYLNNAKGKDGDEKKILLEKSLRCYKKALARAPDETRSFIRTRIRSIKSQIAALKRNKTDENRFTDSEEESEFLVKENTNVSFDDIGGLKEAKEYFKDKLIAPLDHPSLAKEFGKSPVNGLLAYGPPGTGKTMLARAAVTESEDATLIQITPSDILSKYLGQSENKVKTVFEKARDNAPAIVLFDEIESIATDRNLATGNKRSIVNQMLAEISELNSEGDNQLPVLIIGTTNAPLLLDSALLRPGRLESKLYIGPPGTQGRRAIIERKLNQKKNILKDKININRIVKLTEGYTGAECVGGLNEVFNLGFNRAVRNDGEIEKICLDDFIEVFQKRKPSAVETWKSEIKAKLENDPIKDYTWLREVVEDEV